MLSLARDAGGAAGARERLEWWQRGDLAPNPFAGGGVRVAPALRELVSGNAGAAVR
jgi:hypothetical protein